MIKDGGIMTRWMSPTAKFCDRVDWKVEATTTHHQLRATA